MHERFGHYSLGQLPRVPALNILMTTICSAMQLLVELTVVVGRALLGPQQLCSDIPRIKTVQD